MSLIKSIGLQWKSVDISLTNKDMKIEFGNIRDLYSEPQNGIQKCHFFLSLGDICLFKVCLEKLEEFFFKFRITIFQLKLQFYTRKSLRKPNKLY